MRILRNRGNRIKEQFEGERVFQSMPGKVYYPVNLDLLGKPCVIVGGGLVAVRKARSLLSFGAKVTVISPALGKGMLGLFRSGQVLWVKRKYWPGSIKGFFLGIAATNDPVVNAAVAKYGMSRNMLVNVVDVPKMCNFIVPSVLRQGDLVISVSTSGKSPMVAQQLKNEIKDLVGSHYASLIKMLGSARPRIQSMHASMAKRKAVYRQILGSPILELLQQGKLRQASRMLDVFIEAT